MLLCPIDLCESSGIIIMSQVTTLGRLPRVVLLVLVVIPPLLWLLLGVGRIFIMTSYHSLDESYARCFVMLLETLYYGDLVGYSLPWKLFYFVF